MPNIKLISWMPCNPYPLSKAGRQLCPGTYLTEISGIRRRQTKVRKASVDEGMREDVAVLAWHGCKAKRVCAVYEVAIM